MGLVRAKLNKACDYGLRLYREGAYLCVDNPHNVFYEAYFTADQAWIEVPVATKIAPNGVIRFQIKTGGGENAALIRLYIGEERSLAACLCWQGEKNLLELNGESRQFNLKAGKNKKP